MKQLDRRPALPAQPERSPRTPKISVFICSKEIGMTEASGPMRQDPIPTQGQAVGEG